MKNIYCILIIIFLGTACRPAKNVDITLPDYENKLMVECYLEPGSGYKLLLTESVSYLEAVIAKPVDYALVTITYKDKVDTLSFLPTADNSADTIKYFNYVNDKIEVPADYESNFSLKIIDNKGRILTATTKIASPLTLDSIMVAKNENGRSLLVYVNDDQTIARYYRFLVFQKTNNNSQTQSIIASNDQQNLSPYIFMNDKQLIFKSKSDFFTLEKGVLLDSVAARCIAINADYYDFFTSVRNAQSAMSNPFAQPANIKSNVMNGVGIFTGFDSRYRVLKVPE